MGRKWNHPFVLTARSMSVGCVDGMGMVQGAQQQPAQWIFAGRIAAAQVAYLPVRCLPPMLLLWNHSGHITAMLGCLGLW